MAKIRSFSAKVYVNGIAVGGLTDINTSGVDVTMIDTTTHDAVDGFRTFVAGLKDGGTLDLTGKYNYADAGQYEWKAEEGMPHVIYILMSDNSGLAFNVIIGGFQTSNPLDDAVEFTASAKITGEVYPVFPTIAVTGTLTSDGSTAVTFPALLFAGIGSGNGIVEYTSTGTSVAVLTTGYALYYDGGWTLQKITASSADAEWTATGATASPLSATAWTATAPATGTPVLTGS